MLRIITMVVQKTITIREDQEEAIRNNHINLSRFVQDKLDELFKKEKIHTPQDFGGNST